MRHYEDLTGRRFGHLFVIRPDKPIPSGKCFVSTSYCLCDCGKYKVVRNNSLKTGRTKSCGCKCEENRAKILSHSKENVYDLSGEYGIGKANNADIYFLFDKEDYEKIRPYSWLLCHRYIVAAPYKNEIKTIFLHKFVVDIQQGIIDHKNGNTFDCRKINLRPATKSQNAINCKIHKDNSSGATGVSWKKDKKRWKAYITVNGKQIHLGYFREIEEAIKARKEAEKEYFGEFAKQ